MSYGPNQMFPGATESDPNYPKDKFKDNNPSTTNNGTPLKAIRANQDLSLETAIMNDAGFDYNGLPDTPQDSQLFKAYKASLGNGANLLSNHNFIIASTDDSQPAPSATPTSYPPGFQIFSGVFANETSGISNLTYIDGRVSFSGGDFYMPVPNTGAVERATDFVASVADFDGKPRPRGVSFALVGDDYRVTVGVDALDDGSGNATPLASVKFEQGSSATAHKVDSLFDIYGNPSSSFSISVRSCGAIGDGSDATAQFEKAAQNAADRGLSGKYPIVNVDAGEYLISSNISQQATWVLSPGAIITGLPSVPPTNSPDLSRLTGTVVSYDGINQWTTLSVGDPNLSVQKMMGKSYSSEIMGHSDNSAGGLTGTTTTSPRDNIDQSAIGVTGIGVNDNENVVKTVWGLYGEAIQYNEGGTCLAAELTAMKKTGNPVVSHTPFNVGGDNSGVSYCGWFSVGGPNDLSYDADITGHLGFIGKGGAMADKGMIFYTNSVRSGVALALPQTYNITHYATATSTINAVRDGAKTSLVLQDITPTFSPRYETTRSRPNEANSVSGDTISAISNKGAYNGSPNVLSETKVTQTTGWDAGTEKASSKHEVLVAINTSNSLRGVKIQYNDFTSTEDGTMNCGSPSFRWDAVYATTGTINTSDEREKTELLEIEDVERAVALQIKSTMRKFKFKDAVKIKGEDKARIHFGVGAQTVRTIFEDNGLNPDQYALFCYDEWDDEFEVVVLEDAEYETVVLHDEVLMEDGSVNTPKITEQKLIKEPVTESRLVRSAGNRYGIRYEELLCFILASI